MEEEEYNDIAIYIYKTKSIHRMQNLVMFDLQVSPQYISEEDNETESEN